MSGSYCSTLPVEEGSASLGITVPISAGNCPAALPGSQTPSLHPHHDGDTSLFSKHLRLSRWGQGTHPHPEAGTVSGLASPRVTHGQHRRGVRDLPTQESQPPLCTTVSGYTGAERCLVSL